MNVNELLSKPELLTQLAEEAAELSQAALKLRRAMTGENPTPKTVTECMAAMNEEVADVEICLNELGFYRGFLTLERCNLYESKTRRWIDRLMARPKSKLSTMYGVMMGSEKNG